MTDSAYNIPLLSPYDTVGDPDAAQEYIKKHQGEADRFGGQADSVMRQREDMVAQANKVLDEATAALKASRQGRTNLPLLEMGAAMLATPGNFGTQLGAGLGALSKGISRDRASADDFQEKIARIAIQRAGLGDAPLRDKLAYLRQMQLGSMGAARDIEKMAIRTRTVDETSQGTNILRLYDAARKNIQSQFAGQEAMDPKLLSDAVNEEFVRLIGLYNDNAPKGRQIDVNTAWKYAGVSPTPQGDIVPVGGGNVPQETAIQRAQREAQAKKRFELPSDEQRREIGIPPLDVPSPYQGVDIDTARKMYQSANTAFDKEQKDTIDAMSMAADNAIKAKQFMTDYRRSSRTGGVGGMLPGAGSTEANRMDNISATLQSQGVPKGQGAVSDFERRLFGRMTLRRDSTEAANQTVVDAYDMMERRLREKQSFEDAYFRTHRTTAGMATAWEKYINSPEGRLLTEDKKGNVIINKDHKSWKEWFKSQEKGASKIDASKVIALGPEYD